MRLVLNGSKRVQTLNSFFVNELVSKSFGKEVLRYIVIGHPTREFEIGKEVIFVDVVGVCS